VPSVRLQYRFPTEASYSWQTSVATITDTPFEQSTHSVVVSGTLDEKVVEHDEKGVVLILKVTPRSMKIDTNDAKVPPSSSMTVRVNRIGKLLQVVEEPTTGPVVKDMDLKQFLAELSPPLAALPVKNRSRWDAPLVLRSGAELVQLKGTGKLVGFHLAERRRLADIEIERAGPITTTQTKDKASLTLSGKTNQLQRSAVDIDRGILQSSEDHTTSHFKIGIGGSTGKGPVKGTVTIRLITKIRLGSVKT
jgi:hypothetical protein